MTIDLDQVESVETWHKWKMAIIKPIYKKGDIAQPSNYRPISLTSVISKIFESIIYEKIEMFFFKITLYRFLSMDFRK